MARALGERTKELTALHRTATLLENDQLAVADLLQGLVDLLPAAFQFPETARARVRYGSIERASPGFDEGLESLASAFMSRDGVSGALEVVYVTRHPHGVEGPFLAEERRLLDSLARMVTTTLDRRLAQAATAKAEADLRHALAETEAERDRARMLLEITTAMTSTLDLNELLATASGLLRGTVPHHVASVTLWEPEANTLRRHALPFPGAAGVRQDGVLLRTDRPTPARTAFDRGETLVFHTSNPDDLGEHAYQVMSAEGLAAACCIPLRTRRGVIGTLNLASPEPDAFTAGRVVVLEQIAAQFAIAVDNALAYKEVSALKDRVDGRKHYLEDESGLHSAAAPRRTGPGVVPSVSLGGQTSADAERETILAALREAGGVIGGPSGAAARLGLKRTTLHSKMRKLGIVRQSS
jgi:transcriptional regulator with GAF, ATPase, and Fis domain